MKITPENVNEVAADLAEDQVAWHLRGQKIWYDAPNGDQHYTERAQDLFNQYYDLFTDSITQEVANA
jgi:hypothetical protein